MKLKIALNTVCQLIAKFATTFSMLLVTVLVTRYLGDQTMGEFAIVLTFVGTFFVLTDFGMNSILVKEFVKKDANSEKIFSKVFVFKLFYGLFLMFVSWLILAFLPYSREIKVSILIASPVILLQSLANVPNVIFQSYLKYEKRLIASVVGSIFAVISIMALIYTDTANLYSLSLFYALSIFVVFIIAFILVKDYFSTRHKLVDVGYYKNLFILSLPIGLSLVVNMLMMYADRWILSIYSSPESVGIYYIAFKVFEVIIIVPTFFMNALYPVMIKTHDNSFNSYKKLMTKSISSLILVAVITSFIVYLTADFLFVLVWGSSMLPAGTVLTILGLGLIFFFTTAPLNWMLLVEKKQKYLIYVYSIAFLFNLVLNLIFIPQYDYIAAATTTVFTEFIVLLLLIMALKFGKPSEKKLS